LNIGPTKYVVDYYVGNTILPTVSSVIWVLLLLVT